MLRELLSILLIIIGASVFSYAQQVFIQPPITNDRCTTISELYSVNINNFESSPIQCAMQVQVNYAGSNFSNGVIARGSLEGAPVFILNQGGTQISTSNINQFFPIRSLEYFDPSFQSYADQTSCLPPGEYEICISLFSLNGQSINFTDQIAQTCFNRVIENDNNIFLVSPFNEQSINTILPVFSWTPIVDIGANSNYTLQIVQVLEGQTSFEAFRSNPLVFEDSNIRSTFYQYPIAARTLDPCANYAWRVNYTESRGFNTFNQAEEILITSELWKFKTSCDDNIVKIIPDEIQPPQLINPNNRQVIVNTRGKLVFQWNEVDSQADLPIEYRLRVVKRNEQQNYNDAIINNSPILTTNISDNNYYAWNYPNDLQFSDQLIWTVVPYDREGNQLFAVNELEIFSFSFEDQETEADCPLKLSQPELISSDYNDVTESWLLKFSKPKETITKQKSLISKLKFGKKSYSISPYISDLKINVTSDQYEIRNEFSKGDLIYVELSPSNRNKIREKENVVISFFKTIDSSDGICMSSVDANLEIEGAKLDVDECDAIIRNFDLESMNFFEGELPDFDRIKGFFNPNFEYDIYPPSGYVVISEKITLNRIHTNPIPLRFSQFPDSPTKSKYIIAPDWDKYPDPISVLSSNLVNFEVEACLQIICKNDATNKECIAEKCIPIIHNGAALELPELTKLEVIRDFPKLEPDNSILVELDIEDNALDFPDYDIEYGKLVFETTDASITLEVVERDEGSHTYKILPKDPATLETIDLTVVDLDNTALEIKTSFDYNILDKDDPGSLPVLELDTSIILPLIPIGNLCELQITVFNRKTDTYPFISGELVNTDNDTIKDGFKLDFSIDTREQPNRTDLYQQNHRVDFTINSSSIPIQIDTITKAGRVQTYAIVPDWGNVPQNERDINAISFDIKACLRIDFNDINANTNCTQVRCIDILNVGDNTESNTDCSIEIQDFSLSTEFEEGNLNFLQFAEPQSEFFFHTFNRQLSYNDGDPDYSTKIYDVVFETIESNIPLIHTSINNSSTEYATIPLWEESFDVVTKQDISYKAYACFSADLMYKEGTNEEEYVCPIDSCMIIEFVGNNVNNQNSNCSLIVDFTIEKDQNDIHIFTSALANKDPNYEYDYEWSFSDGQSAIGESTINSFLEPLEQSATLRVVGPDQYGNICEDELTKSLNIRPGCDYQACSPSCGTLLNASLKVNDIIKLCGGLEVIVTNLSSGSASNASGSGIVRIPWLLSDLEVAFSNISINSNYELCDGEILAKEYDTAPTLPQDLATNVALGLLDGQLTAVDNYIDGLDIKSIPKDVVIDAAQDQITNIRVPLGFNNVESDTVETNKTNYTLAISEFKFTPGQNYLQAFAAVELNNEDITFNGRLYFKSDNFFFNATGPILNTGNSPDLGFEILRPTKLQYGTNNGDPIHLIFNDDSVEDSWGGTSLKLTSECNQPYRFCLKADIDIEMPLSWFEPLEIDDANPLEKVKANTKIEFCDFKDIITQISLPACHITNTSGLELEVQELTWDHSSTRNADNFSFPENYDETGIPDEAEAFKGFFLKSARVLLPEDLSTYSDNRRLEVELEDWIIHKGYGVSGKILADNIVTFPDMNVSDLGGSIDTFRFEMVNSTITHGYLKGEITLPICDYDEPGQPINKMDFKAMYGSYPPNTVTSGLLFQISPQQDYDCPFFANGQLEIYSTSNLYFAFSKDNSAVDFTLNGKLNFPNLEINAPIGDFSYELQMDATYENVNFNYTKPRGEEKGSILFNHGVWSFASPQKKLNRFNFSIENFQSVTEYDLKEGELYVGGIGFDAVVNLGDKIGGIAGLKILGSIEKNPGERLKAGYKGLDVSKIGLYANLSAVKLDGEIEFLSDAVYGKAVKGNVSAEFKKVSSAVYAGVLFGNKSTATDPNGYRYFQVQAKAIWPEPGIPLFPGLALRGVGAGFYNNMTASFEPSASNIDVSNQELNASNGSGGSDAPNPNAVWNGVTFTPAKDSLGFKLQFELASTPKEESFNGNLGLSGEINKSTRGLVRLGIDGNIWAGAKMTERNKAFLRGSLEAYYDFTDDIFDLNAEVDLIKNGLIAHADLKFNINGKTNKYYFHFGTPINQNTTVSLSYKSLFQSKMYLMFGNHNVFAPSNYIMQTTIDGLNDAGYGGGFSGVNYGTNTIKTGRGFAAGIGIGVRATDEINIGLRFKYDIGAGAEFHLSMLYYGSSSFCGQNSIGMNGYYLKTNLTAWALASGDIRILGKWREILSLSAVANLNANFPNPWGGWGDLYGRIRVLGGLFDKNKKIDFEFGTKCFPSFTTSSETYEQENVIEDLYIFDQVMVEEIDGFDNTLPLRWKTSYTPSERFTLPEQQSDGSVRNRNFKVDFKPTLLEKDNTVWKEIDDPRYDPTWGVDPIGRWFHVYNGGRVNEKKIEVYRRTSNGEGFYPPTNWNQSANAKVNYGEILVGDFDGNGHDDILYQSSQDGGAIIRKGGFVQFTNPEIWTNESNGGLKWIVGNFNGDQYDDIGYYIPDVGFKVLLSNGNSFGESMLWSSEIDDFGYGVYIADFDDNGSDDLYTYAGPNAQSLDWCNVYHSTDINFSSSIQYNWRDYEGDYANTMNEGSPNFGHFNLDDELDYISKSFSSDSTVIYLRVFGDENIKFNSYLKNDVSDIIIGDFSGDGLHDLLVNYPGGGYKQTEEIMVNSLNPNTEYKFILNGTIHEIGTAEPIVEETIIREFKTDENGEIPATSSSEDYSDSNRQSASAPILTANISDSINQIPENPPIPPSTQSSSINSRKK